MSGFNRHSEWGGGTCHAHRKRLYSTRRSARTVARQVDRTMRAYRCDTLPGYWHIGHIPREVARGEVSKEDWLTGRWRSRRAS